jgi:hypothetical protein
MSLLRRRNGSDLMTSPRKLAVLCWHVLTKDEDYLWARRALVVFRHPSVAYITNC